LNLVDIRKEILYPQI
jgi:hypothetical protein